MECVWSNLHPRSCLSLLSSATIPTVLLGDILGGKWRR